MKSEEFLSHFSLRPNVKFLIAITVFIFIFIMIVIRILPTGGKLSTIMDEFIWLDKLHRVEDARELSALAVKKAEEKFGVDNPQMAFYLLTAGRFHILAKDLDLAEEYLERALQIVVDGGRS